MKDLKRFLIRVVKEIKPGLEIDPDLSIFSYRNGFDKRDGGYFLLSISEEFNIDLNNLVESLDEKQSLYSLNSIASGIYRILEDRDA